MSGLLRMPKVREKLDVKSNLTAKAWCARHGVEVLSLNRTARAVRVDQFEAALEKAASAASRFEG